MRLSNPKVCRDFARGTRRYVQGTEMHCRSAPKARPPYPQRFGGLRDLAGVGCDPSVGADSNTGSIE